MVDVLLYVEDPGAANFIAGVPKGLSSLGISSVVIAHAHAKKQLDKHGVVYVELAQSDIASDLIQLYQPKVIASGTTDRIESIQHGLISKGKSHGVMTIGLVDGPASYEYRFRGDGDHATYYCPDFLVVVDQATADDYERIGVPVSSIKIMGHPHYDTIYGHKARLNTANLAALKARLFEGVGQRKVLMFAAEISTSRGHADHSPRENDSYQSEVGYIERSKILLENFIASVKTLTEKPYLVLRLHPKNQADEFEEFHDYFDLISQGGLSIDRVYAADMVVGITSILLDEAAMLGTPVVAMIRREVEMN